MALQLLSVAAGSYLSGTACLSWCGQVQELLSVAFPFPHPNLIILALEVAARCHIGPIISQSSLWKHQCEKVVSGFAVCLMQHISQTPHADSVIYNCAEMTCLTAP